MRFGEGFMLNGGIGLQKGICLHEFCASQSLKFLNNYITYQYMP